MLRAEADIPLDPHLEVVDDGGFAERGADFGERCIKRRAVRLPYGGGGTVKAGTVAPLARALDHVAFSN